MTINEISYSVDLMSRSTKDRNELHVNKKDVSNFSSQLPSIVISSSAKRVNQNETVTVVDELVVHHHPSSNASPSASGQQPSSTSNHNNHTNCTGKQRAKMEPMPNFQSQIEVHVDGTPESMSHNQMRVPVCIDVSLEDSSNETLNSANEDNVRSTISRPTSLTSPAVTLNTPKPPEFSISPAESLSLSKASSNEQMSSSVFHLPAAYKSPHSPSSLSVNFCK